MITVLAALLLCSVVMNARNKAAKEVEKLTSRRDPSASPAAAPVKAGKGKGAAGKKAKKA